MKTLVLNVDRDDDFGRKAKVKSPIVGYRSNLDAANKLGQVDPEDSDLNAIFSAISVFNKLKEEGKDVEVATICGHINVGIKSDEILTNQIEEVMRQTGAERVILVSDGAEDEYILPIIQSRLKITSINRVSVKQSHELEDTYYRILKLLDDEKVLKQFILPIALVLIVWAFFILIDLAASGFGAMLLTLGGYLLIRVFKWEKNLAIMWEEIKSGFLTGRLSIYTYIIAAVIITAFVFFAYTNTNFKSDVTLLPILSFSRNIIWGLVLAFLVIIIGRVIDVSVRNKKKAWKYWIMPFTLFAFGFLSFAVVEALYKALINWPREFDLNPFLTMHFIGYTSTGIMIALVGAITHHYIKEMHNTEEKRLELEKQTTQVVEQN